MRRVLRKREADARLFLRDYSLFNAKFCDSLSFASLCEIIKNSMTSEKVKRELRQEICWSIKHGNKSGFDKLQSLELVPALLSVNLVIKQLNMNFVPRLLRLGSPIKFPMFKKRKSDGKESQSDNNLMKFFLNSQLESHIYSNEKK